MEAMKTATPEVRFIVIKAYSDYAAGLKMQRMHCALLKKGAVMGDDKAGEAPCAQDMGDTLHCL